MLRLSLGPILIATVLAAFVGFLLVFNLTAFF